MQASHCLKFRAKYLEVGAGHDVAEGQGFERESNAVLEGFHTSLVARHGWSVSSCKHTQRPGRDESEESKRPVTFQVAFVICLTPHTQKHPSSIKGRMKALSREAQRRFSGPLLAMGHLAGA